MLEGSIVALITPFNDNLTINFNKLKELINNQIENKTDALLILGTTSESATLTPHEKDMLVDFVFKLAQKRIKIIIGITENATAKAITTIKKYDIYQPDAFLVITPYYNRTNETGLYEHFKEIAQTTKTAIILYNIPSRTGVNINVSVMEKLKTIPNIIGVKEASKDITHILDVKKICDNKFKLFCGNDDLAILFKGLGAKGFINVYGNINPTFFKNFVTFSLEDVEVYFYKHYELIKALFLETNPIPIKTLMNYCGYDVGLFRLPLSQMALGNYQKLITMANLKN